MMRRLAAALLRRAFRVLLRANTGPVDALVYALALCWLAFLSCTPDAAYAQSGLHTVLAYKAVWVWPALLATIATPIGWMSDRPWVHHGARVVSVSWWVYIGVATALVTPTIVVFWGQAICCMFAAVWLLAREGANDVAAPSGGG
jgi:hypothetical protein